MMKSRTYTAESPERLSSLEELRSRHLSLLQDLPEEDVSEEQMDRIHDFLTCAVATGTIIDDAKGRREAQGLIDYWASSLYTSMSWSNKPTRATERLKAADTVLANFDSSFLNDIVVSADVKLKNLSEADLELARRILLRMTVLNPQTKTFSGRTVPRSTLDSLGDPARVEHIVAQLKSSGALRSNEVDEVEHIGLAHASLVRIWPNLSGWLDRRLKFREAAEFWDSHGRERGALLSEGSLLKEALTYRDLGELEEDFAEASRLRRIKGLQGVLFTLGTLSFLLLVVACFAVGLARNLGKQKIELKQQTEDLTEKTRQLEERNTELEEQQRAYEEARAVSQQSQSDAVKQSARFRQLADTILATSMSANSPELRAIVQRYQPSDDENVWRMKPREPDQPITPGSCIHVKDGNEVTGSAGVFVTDETGQVLMLAPEFLVGDEPGRKVYSACADGTEQFMGVVMSSPPTKVRSLNMLSRVKITVPDLVSNKIPKIGMVTEVASDVRPGDDVVFLGYGSGERKEGKVLRVEGDEVITNRISTAGDAGAPVLNARGELVGLIVAAANDTTIIASIKGIMSRHDLRLLKRSPPVD